MKCGNKYRQSIVKEDHYSLLKEPNSEYIGHVTLAAEDANSICDSIYDDLVEDNTCDLTHLSVAGCDGTVLNTGKFNGMIRGPIGRKLNECEKCPIVSFARVAVSHSLEILIIKTLALIRSIYMTVFMLSN